MVSDEMQAEGWIEHQGGACPVHEMSFPEALLRGGGVRACLAMHLDWEHRGCRDDIVAYRPEQPVPERKAA
jgi:hypothetical protein